MASKAAIKDVGRALEMPYAEVEKIAKMIPPPVRGRNVSIEDAIEQNPELKRAIDTDARVTRRDRNRAAARGLLAPRFGSRGRRCDFAEAAPRAGADRKDGARMK